MVLQASVAVADQAGLDALTMQAVADRLGVTPMALYRHVANKADLLDGVVECLLTEFPLPDPERPWRVRLRQLGRSVRQTAQRHPAVFPLLLMRPAGTPAARRVRDAVHAALYEAGVPVNEVPRAERLLSTMALGFATSEVGGRFAGRSVDEIDADFACLEMVIEHVLEWWPETTPTGETPQDSPGHVRTDHRGQLPVARRTSED
jgi:AcrR family transcriptional regulator